MPRNRDFSIAPEVEDDFLMERPKRNYGVISLVLCISSIMGSIIAVFGAPALMSGGDTMALYGLILMFAMLAVAAICSPLALIYAGAGIATDKGKLQAIATLTLFFGSIIVSAILAFLGFAAIATQISELAPEETQNIQIESPPPPPKADIADAP